MCGRIFQIHNLRKLLQLAGTRLLRNGKRGGQNYNAGPTNFIPAIRQVIYYFQINHQQANSGTDKHQQTELQSQYKNEKFEEEITEGLTQKWLDEAVESQTEQFPNKLVEQNNNRELCFLPFGLTGSSQLLINLRIEDVGSKKFFAKYLNTSRCAIIASGYYEWNDKKQGFCFKHKSQQQECLYLAGIVLENQAIVIFTREATKQIGHIHPRMPVLLEEDELDAWLDGQNNPWGTLVERGIMNESKNKWNSIAFYEAAPYVNKIKNKSAECILSKEEYQKKQDKMGIKRFFSVQKKSPQKLDHKTEQQKDELPKTDKKSTLKEDNLMEEKKVANQEQQINEKLTEISKPVKKIKKNSNIQEEDKDKYEKDFEDAYKKFFNEVK